MRRWTRGAAWFTGTLTLALLALMALGALQTRGLSLGRCSVEICHGRLDIARASVPLRWLAGGVWMLQVPGSNAVLTLGPDSSWRPSSQRGTVTVGSAVSSVSYSLSAVFVPLWPWTVLFACSGAVLWTLGRGRAAGHCAACGYDLRGLRPGACPECGAGPAAA